MTLELRFFAVFCTFQAGESSFPFSSPVVLPSKQSTASSFGQMQITSLTL